jgi:single-strand DNA-binding protein
MLNQVVLVGRLYEMKEVGESNVLITLATPRSYKNENGEYETDYIDVLLRGSVATNTLEYCKKGDLIGVKGKIQRYGNDYTANGFPILEIIAEKVTFLQSSKGE